MNIIQQFKDASGNNIYPIGYAQGGMKMDLLWTNPSPTSEFSAQTVSVDLSGYDAFYVECTVQSSYPTLKSSSVILANSSSTCSGIDGGGYVRSRTITCNNNGFTTESGRYVQKDGQGVANDSCIPYRIYGIKMSYIVPTSVHGLQYVEV